MEAGGGIVVKGRGCVIERHGSSRGTWGLYKELKTLCIRRKGSDAP